MYFKEFPKIYYKFDIAGKEKLLVVKDISLNIRVIKELLNNILLFDEYYIQDGDTPEIIAEKFYGNPTLHWTVMLVNDKYDYINDYPKSSYSLEQYITEKYGAGHENDHHSLFGRLHYQNVDGIVSELKPGQLLIESNLTAVTNADYEFALNEDKRKIKLISRDVINKFVDNIQEVFKTNV